MTIFFLSENINVIKLCTTHLIYLNVIHAFHTHCCALQYNSSVNVLH